MSYKIAVCLCLLLASQAFADKPASPQPTDTTKPQVRVDPAASAAASTIGGLAGPAVSAFTAGVLNPTQASGLVSNALLAAGYSGKALANKAGAAGALIGGLFAGEAQKLAAVLSAHNSAGQALVDLVTAINSLNIAGTNAAVGAADSALSGILGKIKSEALAVGKIYTSLLNEFGRAVGNDLNAISTLAGGSLKSLNPISLGIDKLQFHLESLISFLQGAVDISVASPDKAVALGPFIETLKAVKGLLDALQTALIGPQGGVLAVLDTAVQAATGLAESAGTAAAGAVATAANAIPAALSSLGLGDVSTLTSLVQTAQGLLSKLGL